MDTMHTQENKQNIVWIALLLSVFPILDPYAIGTEGVSFMIVDAFAIFTVLWSFAKNQIVLNKVLSYLLLSIVAISLIAAMVTLHGTLNLTLEVKVLIVQLILLMAFGFLWANVNKPLFFKTVVAIGVVCASLAIVQYIAVNLGFVNFYSGRLPFPVGSENHFGGLIDLNTGDVRVHSFFEEPSYLALFELPLFAYCIKQRKIFCALLIGAACLVSSTVIGLAGLLIILLYSIFADSSIKFKHKIRALVVIGIAILGCIYLYYRNATVKALVDYYAFRLTNLETDMQRAESSASYRLTGNINMFRYYPILNKIFGTGINQHGVYFNLEKNYSNDFVTTIMDFGILGVIVLLVALCALYRRISKDGKIYFILFVMVMAVDHIWFNIYFFYLLTWCVLHYKESDNLCIRVN